jgi:hypothetical protein
VPEIRDYAQALAMSFPADFDDPMIRPLLRQVFGWMTEFERWVGETAGLDY